MSEQETILWRDGHSGQELLSQLRKWVSRGEHEHGSAERWRTLMHLLANNDKRLTMEIWKDKQHWSRTRKKSIITIIDAEAKSFVSTQVKERMRAGTLSKIVCWTGNFVEACDYLIDNRIAFAGYHQNRNRM